MADNTADFTRKILVDVELKSEQLKSDLPAIIGEIDRLTQSQKAAQKAGETATTAYINNAAQLRNLKAEVRDTNKYIDNVAKAVNAETGSIQQNRAVLSLVTSDYVKLGQAEGQTAASTVKLGGNVNDLTNRLKEQEAQIGQTYRNVGNYEGSLKGLFGELSAAIPGLGQFTNTISTLTEVAGFLPMIGTKAAAGITSMAKSVGNAGGQFANFAGFKQFGTEAKEAEVATEGVAESATAAGAATEAAGAGAEAGAAGMTGLAAAATAVLGVLLLIIAPLLLLGDYLKDIEPLSDSISNHWAGMKASFKAMANTIREGDFSNLSQNMSDADKKAQELNQDILELNRNMLVSDAATAKENEFISTQLLKLRNIHTTADQATQIFNGIQQTAEQQYQRTWHLAFDGYRAYAGQIINAAGLTQKEYDKLLKGGVAYAEQLKKNGASFSEDLIESLQKSQIAMSQAEGIRDQSTQRAQNREEQRIAKEKAAAEAAANKAEALKEREQAAQVEAENILHQSISKQLQFIYEGYGQQVVAADQTYNDQLSKLKVFLAKKLITQAEAERVELQLTKQHNADIAKVIIDFRKNDEAAYMASANQLVDLQNSLIKNDLQRTIAGIKEKTLSEVEAIRESNADVLKTIAQLQSELKNTNGTFSKSELKELQDRLDIEAGIYLNNKDKIIAINNQQIEQIRLAKEAAQQKAQSSQDAAAVITTKPGSENPFSDASKNHLAATYKQIDDEYSYRLQKAQEAGQDTSQIYAEWGQKTLDVAKANIQAKVDIEVRAEQLVQNTVSDIIGNNIKAGEQNALKGLENQKSNELNNQSLTNTQKQLINQKYQKLEDAEKLKAFKAQQKLQVANAIINGAVAVTAALALPPPADIIKIAFIAATTAANVAKILTEKPAFAKGGAFESDGRGAMLPGYSRRDDTNATLRSGEAVVVSEAMRVPWARNTVSKINEMFGGRSFAVNGAKPAFALGGLFTDGGNANRYFSQPVSDQTGMANTLAYQLINNFPNIYVDVKDVNEQQGILAKTNNRVVL